MKSKNLKKGKGFNFNNYQKKIQLIITNEKVGQI